MKKKLLVLAYEYYPTENANTRIIRKTCELLAKDFAIDLVTPEVDHGAGHGVGHGGRVCLTQMDQPDPVPATHFNILRVPSYSFHKEKCTATPTPATCARMLAEKALGKLTHDETRMLERLYEREVRKKINIKNYDAVISFSAPILAHGCASRMVRGTKTPWLAICFDPYFDHRIFGPEHLEERKKREEKYMEPASEVMVMFPTDRDYRKAGVAFRDKIRGFETPGVGHGGRVPMTQTQDSAAHGTQAPGCTGAAEAAKVDQTDDNAGATGACAPVIHCAFFGSMYREIRDPRPAIALFNEAAKDPEIEVTFAGPLEGLPEEELFPKNGNIQYLGTLKGEALAQTYAETDVLINIGNSVDNQMPSKIFEYITTGKPVINIYKSPECPTLKYLAKYPLALNIPEESLQTDLQNKAEEVKAFCKTNRTNRVPQEEIQRTFAANTFEAFAATIANWITGVESV